jgi:type IV pilus biogenesis/stability protein PilW
MQRALQSGSCLISNILVYLTVSAYIAITFTSCASAPSKETLGKAESHHKMGISYIENGQYDEALMEFKKAIKLNPRKKETLNYLGFISMHFKKYDEAVTYYKKAISIDPGYSEAMNNLGVTYAETGKWDQAIKYFDDALANPMYRAPETAYANKGYALYMKGDYHNAEISVKEALVRSNRFPLALYVLGLIYTKIGNDEAAIEEFKKAIGLVPDYVEVHMELAKAYLRQGDNAKALKHFEAVLDYDNNPIRLREASENINRLKY